MGIRDGGAYRYAGVKMVVFTKTLVDIRPNRRVDMRSGAAEREHTHRPRVFGSAIRPLWPSFDPLAGIADDADRNRP